MDSEKWIIFREAVVDPRKGQPEKPGGYFRPRFHAAGISPRKNIVFSLLSLWLILGLPGFRSYLWIYNPENGDSAGFYEWDTTKDGENYCLSMTARFMTNCSAPGSVSFKVIPNI